METFTLQQYDELKKNLPASISGEDFASLTKIKMDNGQLSRPFTVEESPFVICAEEGVTVTRFLEAATDKLNPFMVRMHNPLLQLYTLSLPKQIYVISVPDGMELKKPIHINLNPLKNNLACGILVHVGKNAKATVIEEFTQKKTDSVILYNLQIKAEEDSQVRLITVQDVSREAQWFEFRETLAEKGANVHLVNAQLGAKSSFSRITQYGLGEHPTLNTDVLMRTQGSQQFECTLSNVFQQKNGGGEMNARGVAQDQSSLVMNGIIKIERNGGGTNTYLHQNALLLSREAKVGATPSLEIDTNDVKASHGAGISNLSEDAIFYAKSRGIREAEARRMMAVGFLSENLRGISDLPEIQEMVQNLI